MYVQFRVDFIVETLNFLRAEAQMMWYGKKKICTKFEIDRATQRGG